MSPHTFGYSEKRGVPEPLLQLQTNYIFVEGVHLVEVPDTQCNFAQCLDRSSTAPTAQGSASVASIIEITSSPKG